jgi:transcriptional regulator with XRE-family HTH domain
MKERILNPVKRERLALGLTIQELAIMAGTGAATVYQVETGALTRVPATLCSVLASLGVNVDQLHEDYYKWRIGESERLFVETRQGLSARFAN